MTETPSGGPGRYTVDSIGDPTLGAISDSPDPRTESELRHWQSERQRADVEAAFQNIAERKKYADRIFWLVAGWLALTGYVVLCQGYAAKSFWLSDAVMIALITTTTSGVIGVLVIVVKYLFPTKN